MFGNFRGNLKAARFRQQQKSLSLPINNQHMYCKPNLESFRTYFTRSTILQVALFLHHALNRVFAAV